MLTKNDLIESFLNEGRICIHLFGKIPEGGMDYRPTPGQRNTLDLLRYISHDIISSVEGMVNGNWDTYDAHIEASKTMADKELPQAMEKQMQAIKIVLEAVSEEEYMTKEAKVPWGETFKLGRALLEMSYRCIVAYRMQLFLYAKQAGNDKIGTANNWNGVDWKPKETKETEE